MHAHGIRREQSVESKMWNACIVYTLCISYVCWWTRTKWEHKVSLCMRRASKIGFITRTHSYKTHAHTHAYTNAIMLSDAKTFAPFLSCELALTHSHTDSVLCCDMDLFRFFVSIFIQREMLSFSPFSCALLLYSSFRIDIMCVCLYIYTHIHGAGSVGCCSVLRWRGWTVKERKKPKIHLTLNWALFVRGHRYTFFRS